MNGASAKMYRPERDQVDRERRVDERVVHRPATHESGRLPDEERALLVWSVTGNGRHADALLSACEQEPLDLLLAVQVDHRAEQVALLVLTAGINAERSADAAVAAGLVDVAVHRERRLVLLDRLAHGGRADRLHGAAGVLQHHVGRQLGRVVEP